MSLDVLSKTGLEDSVVGRILSDTNFVLQVISLMAFMLAIVFVFEISNLETEKVTNPKEGIVGASPDLESGRANGIPGNDAPHQGHNVTLPPQATENGQPLNEVYAEVTGMTNYKSALLRFPFQFVPKPPSGVSLQVCFSMPLTMCQYQKCTKFSSPLSSKA